MPAMRDHPQPRSLQALLRQRRRLLGLPERAPRWGLALSGGGIRSATFCLGLTRALAAQRRLLRFDLLSTVSGGGYLGGLIGRLFDRSSSAEQARAVEQGFGADDTRWCHWWLRKGSRYLTPNGFSDALEIAAVFLRNLLALHLEFAQWGLMLGFAMLGCNAAVAWAGGTGQLPSALLWLALPLLALGLLLLSAYWASAPPRAERHQEPAHERPAEGRWLLLFVLLAVLLMAWGTLQPDTRLRLAARLEAWRPALLLLLALGLAGVLLTRLALRRLLRRAAARLPGPRVLLRLRTQLRRRLQRWLGGLIGALLALAALALLDRAAWWLAFGEQGWGGWVGGGAALGLALARLAGPRLAALSPHLPKLLRLPLLWLAEGVGWLLLAVLSWLWVALAYRSGVQVAADGSLLPDTIWVALAGLGGLGLLQLLSGRRRQFVNLSSLHAFYRERLGRVYLGAANGERFPARHAVAGNAALAAVPSHRAPLRAGDDHGDDDCPLSDYAPQQGGGPVHLINVCANETQDLRGGLSNPDRRGRLLTLAPGGLARLGLDGWRPLARAQALSLASWLAVSGAALAPGLGERTRLGRAALFTLLGLRLGLWWNPGALLPRPGGWRRRAGLQQPASRPSSRARLLGNELLGRFTLRHGPWFLSDGGHVENTGVYALLAERCEFIVMADCSADPQYRFADLENLVRKARIDLGVDIRFQRPRAAGSLQAHPQFGGLADLADAGAQACIALARVVYGGRRAEGLLVLVKPNVFAGLPLDLQHFKRAEPLFPQQGSGDQSFTEAQWESYERLGRELGQRLAPLLASRCGGSWGDWLAGLEDDPGPSAQRLQAADSSSETALKPGVRAGLGAGALLTAALSLWAVADLLRPPPAPEPLLAPLMSLYGKLGAGGGSGGSGGEALTPLAAQWLQLAAQHCPDGEQAQPLRDSRLAQCVLADTRRLCELQQPASPACRRLLQAQHEPGHGFCLDAAAEQRRRQAEADGRPPPWYAGPRPQRPGCLESRPS